MTAQEIVAVAVSVGGSGGALMLALRGLVTAAAHALKARSDAALASTTTAAAAQAHDDRVYGDLRRDIEEMRDRLDESDAKGRRCEEMYAEATARADRALSVAMRQQREIDALRREMARRGWTPPEGMETRPLLAEDDDG